MGKSFAAETVIQAPPERIWQILTDAAGYPGWNSTVSKVEGQISPGGSITVHATINPGRAFPVKVSAFDVPSRMVWTGGMPLGLFKGERTFTLTPTGDGTRFAMREEFTGLMSPLIGRSIPDLQPEFEKFAQCLKQRAEGAA